MLRNAFPSLLLSVLAFFAGCQKAERMATVSEENRKEGTTAWQLTKVREDTCRITVPYEEIFLCRSRDIEAYASRASVKSGDTLQVFVSTEPAAQYRVDIFRMGYYGGKGGRHMASIGPLQGITQPTPDDGEKNVRECRWEKSFEIVIPDDWLSGVYLCKMQNELTGYQSYIVFVVKDERKADLMFQVSDLTWQSYNRWPEWRSAYDWTYENGGHNPWHTGPGAEVSFDRPYSFYMNGLPVGLLPNINGSGEFLLWEYPLAYWLEDKGYDVTYVSNLDVHENPDELLRVKGFLSVGHDEYWTREMYDNVTAARDAGVNLLFLGGNSLSGEVYLKPSYDGRPNRIFGRVERFKDEHHLMGAKSYGVGLADWVCVEPDHWVFANTGLKKGDAIEDLVGWEYHGFPLDTIHNVTILATGPMYEPVDGERYAATIYETASGSFVFNAATCWWNMPLSNPPGKPKTLNPRGLFTGHSLDGTRIDARVQTITENLLRRAIQ
jgi:hypothetical protein